MIGVVAAKEDFTIDKENFPDFGKLVEDMKEMGIHLVPIIDAGVKVEEFSNTSFKWLSE